MISGVLLWQARYPAQAYIHTGCPSKTGCACTITYTTYPPLYGRLKIFTFNNHVQCTFKQGRKHQMSLKLSLKFCFATAADKWMFCYCIQQINVLLLQPTNECFATAANKWMFCYCSQQINVLLLQPTNECFATAANK